VGEGLLQAVTYRYAEAVYIERKLKKFCRWGEAAQWGKVGGGEDNQWVGLRQPAETEKILYYVS